MTLAQAFPSRPTSNDEKRRELARRFTNFLTFCGLLWIQPKEGGGRIPLVLTPNQLAYQTRRTKWDLILKGRQIHITTLECARDVWLFFTRKGARVVIVVQSQSDNKPLLDVSYKIRLFMDSIRALMPELRFGIETSHSWTLPDRDATLDIIVAGASDRSASKKGRAGTINRLHVSEASSYENAEATMTALLGAVTPDAEVVVESTPKGAHGWFYEQWMAAQRGTGVFTPHFLEWWHNPEYRVAVPQGRDFEITTPLERVLFQKGAAPESVLWHRERVAIFGEDLVNQEYPSDPDTCFLVSGRSFFDAKLVAEAYRVAELTPYWAKQDIRESGVRQHVHAGREVPAIRVWHEPKPGGLYIVSADPSDGVGGSASAAGVFERGTGQHCATLWGQFRPWVLAKWLVLLARRYNGAMIAPERNNHGGIVLRSLDAEHHYRNVFLDRDGKPGFNTTGPSRVAALDVLEQGFRNRDFQTFDPHLLSEMRTFVVNDQEKAVHAPGSRDDLVIMAAIGWDVVCRTTVPRRKNWVEELPPA